MSDGDEVASSLSGDDLLDTLDDDGRETGKKEPSLNDLIREDERLVNSLKAELSRRDVELESIAQGIRAKEDALREMEESVEATKQLQTLFFNFTSSFHHVDQHLLTRNIHGADSVRALAKKTLASTNSAHRKNLEASKDLKILLNAVSTWTTQATSELSLARATLATKEAHVKGIRHQIGTIQTRMSQKLALLNPAWRLPDELWTVILLDALSRTACSRDYLQHFKEEWKDATGLAELTLSGVCCRWRDLLRATPEAWNTIYIPNRSTEKDIARIRHYYSLANKPHLRLLVQMENDTRQDHTNRLLTLFRHDVVCRSIDILTSHDGVGRVVDLLHFFPPPHELRLLAENGSLPPNVILPFAFGVFVKSLYLCHCRATWAKESVVELEELGTRSTAPNAGLSHFTPGMLKSLKRLAVYSASSEPQPLLQQRTTLSKLVEVACGFQFLLTSLAKEYKLPALKRLIIPLASEYTLEDWELFRHEVEQTSRIQELVLCSMYDGYPRLLSTLISLQDLRSLQLEGSTVDGILMGWQEAWRNSKGARGAFPPLMDLIVEDYTGDGEKSLLVFVDWHYQVILHGGRKLRVTLRSCPNISAGTLARLSAVAELVC
ncbi:hypothetical protein PIIN_07973 [Serendipita indica DSM 11827]|uniref:Uncharacterized protein n=1 Tax=Serendipita indica (strain DSM 11827) TaxID=1109443 RepID=G4TRS6_SERID|nr:hypothetical protein PIIN_07973 [Serendipita indica DSM 11827]